MKPRRRPRSGTVALAAVALSLGAYAPARADVLPTVVTSIDEVNVIHSDAAGTRPALVDWRSTAKVVGGTVDLVAEDTLGAIQRVPRSALGDDVASDFPVTIRGRISTPQCDGSGSAQWISGSDWVSRGKFWAGIEGTTADFTGLHDRHAPDRSQAQWVELGVGGFDRYPPQPDKPGGHLEAQVIGSTFHTLRYVDPAGETASGGCWIGGVARVDARASFGIVSYRAVGGDVALQGDEDLPTAEIPILDGASSISVAWTGGMPGLSVQVNAIPVTDGPGTKLVLRPYVQNPGIWRESRESTMGTDWQLRFYVTAYWDQPFADAAGQVPVRGPVGGPGSELELAPGERALVIQDGRVRRFRADEPSVLELGSSEASLSPAAASGPGGTAFPQLNSCTVETWDQKLVGLPVTPPDRSDDGGTGTPVQSAGIGDAGLPYGVPQGWLGFDLASDPVTGFSLRNATVVGQELGELALPHVRVGGTVHALTPEKAIEGPIAYERQVSWGNARNGYTWDQLMVATVYQVDEVEFTLNWNLLGRVIADDRGVAACGVIMANISDGLNPLNKEVQLHWFVGADLEGHGKTYANQFQLGGYAPIAAEKTVDRDKPFWDLVDNVRLLTLRDKDDPELKWQYQEWAPGAGSTTLAVDHGTRAAAPRSEVNGESIDGVRLGIYLTEEPYVVPDAALKFLGGGRNAGWDSTPLVVYPCTPLLCLG